MISSVIDNTVLSNFAHIQQPRLLATALDQPVTVGAVMTELMAGVELKRIPTVDWTWLPIIELTDEERASAEKLNQTLGRGEAQCIALAASRSWMILTDDRDARRAAHDLGITVSGTLGALMNLVQGQALLLAEADRLLTVMKQHGYHSPVNSLSELTG
jgi:predicted nucleic acid-binding protein